MNQSEIIKVLILEEKWKEAIALGAKHHRLGRNKGDIEKGADALKNPKAYEEKGENIDKVFEKAKEALYDRFIRGNI